MKDPDWSQLPDTTPPRICEVLQRCTKREQKQRLQSIGDARITIEEVLSGNPDGTLRLALTQSRGRWQVMLPWAIAGILAAAVGFLLFHLRLLRHLSVDFRHRAREIWRTKLCDASMNSERVREQGPQKITQFQSLAEFVPPSKNKTAAAISRGGCLKLLYAYLIRALSVLDHSWCRPDHFKLGTHFLNLIGLLLEGCGQGFNLPFL